MNNKLKLTLIIALIIMGIVINNVQAKKIGDNASGQADTAGLGGGVAAGMTSRSLCMTEECKAIRSQIIKISDTIEQYKIKVEQKNQEYTKAKQNNGSIKLEKQVNELKAKLDEEKNKGKDITKLSEELDSKTEKLNTALKEVKSFEEQLNALNQEIITKSTEMKNLNIKLDELSQQQPTDLNKNNPAEPNFNELDEKNENNDQNDVVPESKSYLKSGDLLAWGIPGIPSIPMGGPKHSEKNVQEKKSSDQGYQALRTVEQESEKITEADKDTFLNQLKTQITK